MTGEPRQLGPFTRFFVTVASAAAQWSAGRAWAISLCCLAVPPLVQICAPSGISLSLPYMVASAIAVWCLGSRIGMALTLLTVVGGELANHMQMAGGLFDQSLGTIAHLWNLLARILSLALFALVIGSLRSVLAHERWRAASDSLTGVLNQAAFLRQARHSIADLQQQDRAVVLAYMDLDGFKSVNDRHGHAAGDAVLRAFATGGARVTRATDLFARCGGDEFAALMIVRNCEEGHRVADMLHRRLTEILIETGYDVTCSMGAVVMEGRDAVVDEGTIGQADALMYEAKRAGKNALRVARGTPVAEVLRTSFPPPQDDELQFLLDRIDLADRRLRWTSRRAA